MAWAGTEYLVTATATSLTTALGLTANSPGNHFRQIDIRSNPAALNNVFFGGSGVTVSAARRVVLQAGEAYSFVAVQGHHISTDDIYVIGTANAANIIFVSLVS